MIMVKNNVIIILTAFTTNTRPQRVFFFGSNLRFGGCQSTVTMGFMCWPGEDSFPVSQALGGRKCRHLSYFSTILLQDPTPLHVKIIRSTKLLIICWRKLKLTYLLTESYNHISFFNTRSQLVWVLASSKFYSITWRMISRSAGYKIHFRKQPPFRGNFFPLSVWYLLLLWIYAPWQFVHGSCVFIQSNKLKWTTWKLFESISAISRSSQRPHCFNNVILHLNEINKIINAVVMWNYCKSLPLIQWWGKLLCQNAWENHGNSWLTSTKTQFQQGEKTLRGRVLVVTAVNKNKLECKF